MKRWALIVFAPALLLSATLNADAKPHRSHAAIAAFKREHPCPSNGKTRGACPGFVIDHVKPLACGGPDAPSNMQWQTVADAKAKDKEELKECRGSGRHPR
jgi:hypothetical protein